jgi:hypothetical protein
MNKVILARVLCAIAIWGIGFDQAVAVAQEPIPFSGRPHAPDDPTPISGPRSRVEGVLESTDVKHTITNQEVRLFAYHDVDARCKEIKPTIKINKNPDHGKITVGTGRVKGTLFFGWNYDDARLKCPQDSIEVTTAVYHPDHDFLGKDSVDLTISDGTNVMHRAILVIVGR